MSNVTIKVDASDVEHALDDMEPRDASRAIKKALSKPARFLRGKVKAAAPKGQTGNLRKSVRYKAVRRGPSKPGIIVAPFARHRHLVIQGTKDRYTRAGAFRGRMPSNDFVDRAASAHEREALLMFEDELARQLGLD